jgi:DNA-binding GntR family transcriptional regulator
MVGRTTKGKSVVTPLAQVNRSTLREQVLAQLRQRILSGDLPPGTKLGEVDLAAQLGVSRGTVREALRTLHEGGLLEGVERGSLHVRKLSPPEIREMFEVRLALEGQAIRAILAAPDRERLIDELEARLPQDSTELTPVERFETDLAFHEALCRLGGNQILLSLWSSMKDLMRMTVLSSSSSLDERSQQLMSRDNHQPVVDALRAGEVEPALGVLSEHMDRAVNLWAPREAA